MPTYQANNDVRELFLRHPLPKCWPVIVDLSSNFNRLPSRKGVGSPIKNWKNYCFLPLNHKTYYDVFEIHEIVLVFSNARVAVIYC